jgi:hypothetical protein
MSYSRTYSETISGVVSDTVYYPASEEGGEISVDLSWSEDVEIEIMVETDAFNGSVDSLRGHLDELTATVIATEEAHVLEKAESAGRIADSLNQGFNQLIRSEISQQMAGLKSRVDSLLLKLKGLGQACRRTQQTMQSDYQRITERYAQVFEELDHEAHRRVSTLDVAPISVSNELHEQVGRVFSSRLCGIAAVTSAENARAQMKVVAAGVRAQTQRLLQRALAYLAQEVRMARAIESMTTGTSEVNKAATLTLPVLYMEADSEQGPLRRAWLHADIVPAIKDFNPKAADLFQQKDLPWRSMSESSRRQIEQFLLARVETIRSDQPERDGRIRQNILRLWKAQAPQTLSA